MLYTPMGHPPQDSSFRQSYPGKQTIEIALTAQNFQKVERCIVSVDFFDIFPAIAYYKSPVFEVGLFLP